MNWQREPFWQWWVAQPEIIAADEAARHQQWALTKAQNKIAREEEKLQRSGVSQRRLNLIKRLTGVMPQEVELEMQTARRH